MINAQAFIEPARALGFDWYAGVPCSFLTPFINQVIDDDQLSYLSAANEGDAVAAAAGAIIGGHRGVAMMQNSGLGNAVNPITSLAVAFRIPVLLIVTWRGDPELADEPQHELMGRLTPKLFDEMGIPWEIFPQSAEAVGPVLDRIDQHMRNTSLPYALIMRKGSIEAHDLASRSLGLAQPDAPDRQATFARLEPDQRCQRSEILARIVANTDPAHSIIVATTGFTGRELAALDDRANHLYMVGSMGCASSLGLGIALTQPDKQVIVIDGDGAVLMRMGNLATVGTCGPDNLTHIILDNHVHDSTGAQATVSAGISFPAIAAACGYRTVMSGDQPELIDTLLDGESAGPVFAHMQIKAGTLKDLPRPEHSPIEVRQRLMRHLGTLA